MGDEEDEKTGARDRIRTGEPLQEQILSLSPLTRLGYSRLIVGNMRL